MDWSEKNLCIKCNEGGNLLICSENGCPLALHEGCMRCPARFDDAGRFYCPYCLYKQAVAESRKAREYALERKKALLMFMDQDIPGTEKCLDENKGAEANGNHESKDGEADDGKSRSQIPSTHLDEEGQKINDAEEEKVEEEDSEASASSETQDPPIEVHKERNITDDDGKTVQEEEHETSAASSGAEPSDKMHEHETSNAEDEENIQEEEYEASSASTSQDRSPTLHDRAMRGSKRSEPINRDSETVPVTGKHVKRIEPIDSDSDTVPVTGKRVKRSEPINSDSDTVTVPGKPVKRSDHNKQSSSNVSSPRRSSRRKTPSASRTEKMLNERVGISERLKQAQKPPIKL